MSVYVMVVVVVEQRKCTHTEMATDNVQFDDVLQVEPGHRATLGAWCGVCV